MAKMLEKTSADKLSAMIFNKVDDNSVVAWACKPAINLDNDGNIRNRSTRPNTPAMERPQFKFDCLRGTKTNKRQICSVVMVVVGGGKSGGET